MTDSSQCGGMVEPADPPPSIVVSESSRVGRRLSSSVVAVAAQAPSPIAGSEPSRVRRRPASSVLAVGTLTLVASLAYLCFSQERQHERGKPGTSFPSAETIAQLAGLFPKDSPAPSPGRLRPKGADAVWSELLEVTSTSSQERCQAPPCAHGKIILSPWADLGEEMTHVEGAVVVRRPDLPRHKDMLGPVDSLDYAETLRLYLPAFASSFVIRLIQAREAPRLEKLGPFLDAVEKGNDDAGRYLSPSYVGSNATEMELDGNYVGKNGESGYEDAPSLVAQTDVFVHASGYVWNDKDFVVPPSCGSEQRGVDANFSVPTDFSSHKKVLILNQAWGDSYYHFMAESLPRITVFLDVLLRHHDIQIALRAPRNTWLSRSSYMLQLIELLGMRRDRVVFVETQIHAELAILPDSTPCGEPSAAKANMLRSLLLQVLYPDTGGVPPLLPRPVILLIVRWSKRGLKNNRESTESLARPTKSERSAIMSIPETILGWLRALDNIREGLNKSFADYDVVEFTGHGTIERQLKSFATASVVVGPHGAGLVNVMVSALHTPVLEIGPANCPTCFLQLALRLQHIYARHVPQRINVNHVMGNGTSSDAPCGSWYMPDVNEVVQLVRDLLQAKIDMDTADPPRGRGRDQGQDDDGEGRRQLLAHRSGRAG